MPGGITRSMRARSSGPSRTSSAPTFSSRYLRRLVPGIGTMSSPCTSQYPGERELGGRAALLPRHRLDLAHEVEVFLKVLALETGRVAAVVVRVEVVRAFDLPGQEATAERRVGHETDPEFAHGGEEFAFRLAAPQGVFGLEGRDRMDGVCPPERLRTRLGQPEMAHLAGPHQFRHGAARLLDRRVRIDPVLVVEVDRLDSEPPEARLAGLAHVVRPSVDPQEGAVRGAYVAELGGDHDLIAPVADGAPDQLLVSADSLHVGGVQERDPEIDGAVDGGHRLRLVASGIKVRHAHAAEA